MENPTTQFMSDRYTTSNATLDESCSTIRRLLEDIGGQENLSLFTTLLQRYFENSKNQIRDSEEFNHAISHTAFSFSYAYQDKHLFGLFLKSSPIFVAASWFVQQYTFRKRYEQTVSLWDIIKDTQHDGTAASTIITLGTARVSVPFLSDHDKETIERYYTATETRRRVNEKLSRFYTARNDEWVKFLGTVFPNDLIVKGRIEVMKASTHLKNTRNLNYRVREKIKNTNNKALHKKVMQLGECIRFETVDSEKRSEGSTQNITHKPEFHEHYNVDVGNQDDAISPAIIHQHVEHENIVLQNTEMDIMSFMCVSELTTSSIQVPMGITNVNKEQHKPDTSMVDRSQIDNLIHLFTEETQVFEFEERVENMRKDEKLMDFINTATTAILSTKNSKDIVRLFLQTYLDKQKDGNSEETNDWETLSSTSLQQCGTKASNNSLATESAMTHTTGTPLVQMARTVTSKRRRRTVNFLVDDPRDEKIAIRRFLEEYRKDIIPEDFVMYGGRQHLPHIHNRLDFEPYIHFPWENNSCALDSIMTAWWIIFNNIKNSLQDKIMEIFKQEYTELQELFCEMYDGRLDNVQAKDKVRHIFQGVLDSKYQRGEFIELTPINNHIDEKLYDQNHHTIRNPSLLYWRITITHKCMRTNCVLYDKIVNNTLTQIGEFELLPTPAEVTFRIQDAFMESVSVAYASHKCHVCQDLLNIFIQSNSLPYVIKVKFPTISKHNNTKYKIPFIDKSLILENTRYIILGAIYGDGIHFVFRYIFDDQIFEADGMHLHQNQIKGNIRHSAESIYITSEYEKGMSVKIKGTRLTAIEIYYIRDCTIVT